MAGSFRLLVLLLAASYGLGTSTIYPSIQKGYCGDDWVYPDTDSRSSGSAKKLKGWTDTDFDDCFSECVTLGKFYILVYAKGVQMTTLPLDRLRGTFLSTTFMTCWLWMSVFTACEPISLGIDELVGEAPLFRAESIQDPESDGRQLRVMTWNIKYGSLRAPFWFDCWGDQVSMSVQQVEQNMEAL